MLYASESTNITKQIIDAYNLKSGVPAPPAQPAARHQRRPPAGRQASRSLKAGSPPMTIARAPHRGALAFCVDISIELTNGLFISLAILD